MTTPAVSGGLYLAGLSGAGKTTAARRIGEWLGWPWHDVDGEVERATGRTVAELWAAEGEAFFRAAERAAVAAVVERGGPAVVALGGGTLEDPESRARLAAWGVGVHLYAPPEALAARVRGRPGLRPLLEGRDPVAVLRAMQAARAPRFEGLARVDANGRAAEEVAADAVRALAWPAPEPLGGGVVLGRGALDHAGGIVAAAYPAAEGHAVPVVTDATVWAAHGRALAAGLAARRIAARLCPLPAGEPAKTVDALVQAWRALAAAGADRDAPILVLGGGAVGDVGGLAAATFKRGLPLALFPTTLLAQVDAAIGGKNAINFEGAKNVIGAFHDPFAVALDPLCLLTLPERAYRAGWAEVVKAGLIGDPDLLDLCEQAAGDLLARRLDAVEAAVRRAVRVKLDVVAADPREADRRRALNLGHTLGHALEAAADGRLEHGEAVAIGLVAAARLSEEEGEAERGLSDRVVATLSGLGLPTAPPEPLDPARVRAALRHDKKRQGGALHVVLPLAPGEVRVQPLDDARLDRWVDTTLA